MSTTVTYKGQTLTTVSNDTKTLLTEGKYLEDDLTLVDVSGGGATLITKSISANGTYNASSDSADGYSQVNVAVPASAVDTGTKNITANGNNQDVVGYAAVNVNVPNSYSASDEGKVVSNGALVAQTSDTVTANDTYDTTLINSLTVNVSGGGGGDTTIEDGLVSGNISGAYENGRVTKAKFAAFRGCTSLTSLKLPNITGVPAQCCYGCTSLTLFSAVKATSGNGDLINGCTSLLTVALPKLNDVENNSLNYSSSVQTIDVLGGIIRAAFNNDSSLTTLIIRKTSVSNLVVTSGFNRTPFASGGSGGTIYIPKALYDHLGDGTSSDYKAQTNWATIDGYGTITWAAIEGSYYETHYADGTPIPT